MTHRILIAALAALTAGAFAQKKPLDHSVYDEWKSIQGTSLSDDGRFVLYRIAPQEGDAVLYVRSVSGDKSYQIPRGSGQFTKDGRFAVVTVVPGFAETREARRKRVKAEDMPKNALVILNLESGEQTRIEKVTSFSLAEEDSGWIVYKPDVARPASPAAPAAPSTAAAKPEEKTEAQKEEKPKKKSDHRQGEPIVLRNLSTGAEERIEDVVQYRFSKDGKTLIYTISSKDGSNDGIVWFELPSGRKTQVVKQLGQFPRIALDEKATQLAFLTDKDDYAAKRPTHSLYLFTPQSGKATMLAKEGSTGIPSGWWIPSNATLTFSENGQRVIFSTSPKPAEDPSNPTPDDEKVNVDVWHWQDPVLQPQQLLQAAGERSRSYTAVIHLGANKIVQLATPDMPSVNLGSKQEARYAIGSTNTPYRIEASWDTGYSDYFVVDVQTGQARKILGKFEGNVSLAPDGRSAYAYDEQNRKGLLIDLPSGTTTVVTNGLPYPIWNELEDTFSSPGAYGLAGWTADGAPVIYDAYDLWLVDPKGGKPRSLTGGYGRNADLRLRMVRLDREADTIDLSKPMLLSAFGPSTKQSGFFLMAPGAAPRKIVLEDKSFSSPTKARNADVVFYTRSDFVEFPDLWLADNAELRNARKITDANPQQKLYNWGKAELISWTSNDGIPLQGILIKPEDFDYAKRYPMIVYFYERSSDTLHGYRSPAPSASVINPTMAASNGYLVFIPDIAYKPGYPGESAMSCVIPGVHEVLRRGYVDPKRVGMDGQSWGGYQVAYLATETDLFACGFSGAPVANMFSAYGGIRWGSGLVRQFQYERTQSRIGGTVWDKPMRFFENSPLFFLDKVKTPLLIMHNDKDGAVPWYQGIELFTGLRRLQKPAWLLVYNEEDHNLVQRKNRKDLSIRKHQFFDHYLKGAPMPEWMAKGIPAIDKGRNMGLGTGG